MSGENSPSEESRIWAIETEIRKLPKHARYAFVGRCARRILPLFGARWLGAMALAQMRSLTEVVELIEHAAHLETAASRKSADEAADRAYGASVAALLHGPKQHRSLLTTTAECVEQAARAVAGDEEHIWVCPQYALMACYYAISEDEDNLAADEPRFARAICADFDALSNGAKEGRWTDTTLVPGEYCGNFWPDGLPDKWPNGAIAASLAIDLAVKGVWSGMKVLAKGHPIGQLGLLLDEIRRRNSR